MALTMTIPSDYGYVLNTVHLSSTMTTLDSFPLSRWCQ